MTDPRQKEGKGGRKVAGPGTPSVPARGLKGGRRPGRWVALALAWLLGLVVWAAFFVVAAAHLAPLLGSGWLWVGVSAFFCLGLPLVLAAWLVRPLAGFKKAAWFTGTFLVVPLLAVLGLSAGLRETTGHRLERHGRDLFERIFGPVTRSDLSRQGSDLVSGWAGILRRPAYAADSAPQDAARFAQRAMDARPESSRKRDVFFTGIHKRPLARPEAAPLARGGPTPVRFLLRGGAIMVRGEAAAARSGPVDLVLDTGATLSTLTLEAAKKLGLEEPRVPVQVDLDTAGGRRSFALAVVRRLRVGPAALEHVTVALCDECAPPGLSGLLGLNFIRHFVLSIDEKRRMLTLAAQAGPRDRLADVDPFLELAGVQGAVEGDRFTAGGTVTNRSPRAVLQLRIAAELLDPGDRIVMRHETVVPRIAPGAPQPFRIEGPSHAKLVKYRLETVSARW